MLLTSMILSSWNIRGYNDPLKHGLAMNHVKKYKIEVMGLLETRVRKGKEKALLARWKG